MSTQILIEAQIFTDSFSATGTGEVRSSRLNSVMKHYSIQVTGIGATPTSWSVDLEGSIDGVTFSSILTHATGNGNGGMVVSGTSIAPTLYLRSNVTALVLGSATGIKVNILGE